MLILYFVIRRLFGMLTGFCTAFIALFSYRDILLMLWGHWPERIAFYLLPVALYLFYQYTEKFLHGDAQLSKKNIYLYLLSAVLALTLFFHPIGFFHSIAALIAYAILLLINIRRLPFSILDVGRAGILFIILIALFPYQTGNVFFRAKDEGSAVGVGQWDRLFSWYKQPDTYVGFPDWYFDYSQTSGGYWTIPFIILGIAYCLLKRENKHLMMIGWLVGLYALLHLEIIGKGRGFRSLSASWHLFAPLAALGMLSIPSYFKIAEKKKQISRGILVVIFCIAVLSFNYAPAVKLLTDSYPPPVRLTDDQIAMADWISENTPEDAGIATVGMLTQAKSRWLWMVAKRVTVWPGKPVEGIDPYYVLFDYSDAVLQGQSVVDQVRQAEEQVKTQGQLVFTQNNLKLYQAIEEKQ